MARRNRQRLVRRHREVARHRRTHRTRRHRYCNGRSRRRRQRRGHRALAAVLGDRGRTQNQRQYLGIVIGDGQRPVRRIRHPAAARGAGHRHRLVLGIHRVVHRGDRHRAGAAGLARRNRQRLVRRHREVARHRRTHRTRRHRDRHGRTRSARQRRGHRAHAAVFCNRALRQRQRHRRRRIVVGDGHLRAGHAQPRGAGGALDAEPLAGALVNRILGRVHAELGSAAGLARCNGQRQIRHDRIVGPLGGRIRRVANLDRDGRGGTAGCARQSGSHRRRGGIVSLRHARRRHRQRNRPVVIGNGQRLVRRFRRAAPAACRTGHRHLLVRRISIVVHRSDGHRAGAGRGARRNRQRLVGRQRVIRTGCRADRCVRHRHRNGLA